MATALDIITKAARLIGAVRKGETLDSDEAAEALDTLNNLLSSWASDTLLNLARIQENFTLTASQTFTIGTGKTFDTPAPTIILSAFVRSGGIDYPLTLITEEEYDGIAMKSVSGGPSWFMAYEYSDTDDSGTIKMWPVPTGGDIIYITSEKKTPTISTLATEVFFPSAGANRALVYNLAVDLAPEYGVGIQPELAKVARDSLGAVRGQSARAMKLPYNGGEVRQNNIYTGWYV